MKPDYLKGDCRHLPSYLVCVKLTGVWKMKFRCENMDIFAVHSLLVNVIGNEFTNKVFPCSSPSVQREHQRLLWVFIAQEPTHSFQDDA